VLSGSRQGIGPGFRRGEAFVAMRTALMPGSRHGSMRSSSSATPLCAERGRSPRFLRTRWNRSSRGAMAASTRPLSRFGSTPTVFESSSSRTTRRPGRWASLSTRRRWRCSEPESWPEPSQNLVAFVTRRSQPLPGTGSCTSQGPPRPSDCFGLLDNAIVQLPIRSRRATAKAMTSRSFSTAS